MELHNINNYAGIVHFICVVKEMWETSIHAPIGNMHILATVKAFWRPAGIFHDSELL